jgi:uncharacterized membrane protein HdeD (DUF308 family)
MGTKPVKAPLWSRALRLIFGFLAIGASILALALPAVALVTLMLMLSFSMLFLGLSKLARGISLTPLSKGHRALDLATGLLGIAIGIIVLLFPKLGFGTLIFMLAIGTMSYGIASVGIGASTTRLTKALRALVLMSGVLAIILSLMVMISRPVAILSLVFLLSVSLMIGGVETIVVAVK